MVFLNGHGGNPSLPDTVSRDTRVETGLMAFPVSVSQLGLPAGLVVRTSRSASTAHLDRAEAGGHAVLDLCAHTRHLSLEGAVPTAWVSSDVTANGVVGSPAGASVEVGRRLVDCWTPRLTEALGEVAAFEFPADLGLRTRRVRGTAALPLG